MSSFATVLLLGSLALATGTRSIAHLRKGKQLGKMNPEAVAHTLAAVEGKWLTEAVAFAQCNASDAACQEDTMGEFKKSCQTVVSAVIQSSNGDKSVVSEYLGDICEQPELHSWKKSFCGDFATALNGVLTDDNYVNRDDLPVDTICANFLKRGFLKEAAKEEVARAEKEKQEAIAAQEEEAKKEEEEKEKEAAAEAAEAKDREAAAKAEAAKAAAEVAAKVRAEAQAKADEAAEKAADAAKAKEVAGNSSATVAVVNSTADVSVVANETAASAVPAQTTTEVPANVTAASDTVATNSTAVAAPSNTTK